MEILAGHVEFMYYTLLIMGFWAAVAAADATWLIVR